MKILIAEDDPFERRVLENLVRSLGHETVAVADGEAALGSLTNDVRVIISDWRMPRLDGMELCRKIRARPVAPYIYFILVTDADAARANQEQAAEAGVDDFLSKPVDERELWRRLRVAARMLAATEQVKRLESYLPICGYCKKVRDDQQYWQQIERYIAERTGTAFTHSICPDCFQQHVTPQLIELGLDKQGDSNRKS